MGTFVKLTVEMGTFVKPPVEMDTFVNPPVEMGKLGFFPFHSLTHLS